MGQHNSQSDVSFSLPYPLSVPRCVSVTSGFVLALLRRLTSFHGSLFPHLTVSRACCLHQYFTLKMTHSLSISPNGDSGWHRCFWLVNFMVCFVIHHTDEQGGHDWRVFSGAEMVSERNHCEWTCLLLYIHQYIKHCSTPFGGIKPFYFGKYL